MRKRCSPLTVVAVVGLAAGFIVVCARSTARAAELPRGEQPQPWSFPNEWLPEYTQSVRLQWKRQQDGSWQSEIKLRPGEIRVFLIRTK